MPQMALGALSENWLFKELGDAHWKMICDGLNTKSYNLKNDTHDRLYATFVRIQLDSRPSLKAFRENAECHLDGEIERFGNAMYFSKVTLKSDEAIATGRLMTTFSVRDLTDNTKLAKGEPEVSHNMVAQVTKLPQIGSEYRLLKKKVLEQLVFDDYVFDLDMNTKPIFEMSYNLNPYYDINGVNLLYFAAYPIINDFCEAQYFNTLENLPSRWEQSYYTTYKDVFYYANCNPSDQLTYRLHQCKRLDTDSYLVSSSISRNSDDAIIARVFSVKTKK